MNKPRQRHQVSHVQEYCDEFSFFILIEHKYSCAVSEQGGDIYWEMPVLTELFSFNVTIAVHELGRYPDK